MPFPLDFNIRYGYDSLRSGTFIPVTLRLGGRVIPCDAEVDTGSQVCVFQRELGVSLDVDVEAGLEAICKEKAASGKNLEEKIDGLVSMGVLTEDDAEILHSLRILGNIAAHEVTPHSDSQLAIAMNVVEHLLNGVYILPNVASNLPRRK